MLDPEYVRSLDDEILKDVYYYHNKINDIVDLYTVGCEVSEWDGEKIARSLDLDELKDETVIINTCAVTDLAQKASEKVVERLRRIYPEKKFFIVGCGVDYNKGYYDRYGTALGNEEKFKVENYGLVKRKSGLNMPLNIHRNVGTIKIEDGCYNNCAYCVIHKIRPHYMMPYVKIKAQIEALLSQGKKNIQLIGTEISSYYSDGYHLTELCKKILEDFPEIDNIVMGAIDPASSEIEKLIELMKKEARIYNTLYLCTQSCSDAVLKAMNRRHDVKRLREINKLADGKVNLVFQLIIGFPGETDELFQETVDLIKELKPVDYDTIPFSPRKGTPAYDMPCKIPLEVIEKREQIIYDTIKEYTRGGGFNTDRAFAAFEKDNFERFNAYRPKNLKDCIVFHKDLYNTENLYKLFEVLPGYENEKNDIVILTDYDAGKDKNDLDVNIKLLTMTFGVKVITKIKVDDKVLNYLVNEPYTRFNFNPANFSFRIATFIEFDFAKLKNAPVEDVLKLFRIAETNGLDDLDNMACKLVRAGNREYFNAVKEKYDVTI